MLGVIKDEALSNYKEICRGGGGVAMKSDGRPILGHKRTKEKGSEVRKV